MVNEDQFYEKQLGVSYWYVTHKILLKNILIIFLIIFNVSLLAFVFYSLSLNLVIRQNEYKANLQDLAAPNSDFSFLRQFNLPPAISVSNIQTFPGAKDYDIAAEISNSSLKWFATFDYQFKLGEKLSAVRQGFIMPGEKKKIMDLSVADGNLVTNVIFSHVNWQKEINYAKLVFEKFKFDFKNIKYIPSAELGLEQKVPVNRVSFEVENLSTYNYSNVILQLFLQSGGQVVAINQVPSGILQNGQTKSLEVNFFQRLPKIESVEIIPDVNIFDPNVFLKL